MDSRRLPRTCLACLVPLLLSSALAGCGGDAPEKKAARPTESQVSQAAQVCRDKWNDLARETDPDLGVAVKRVFQQPLDSLNANAVYHASTAEADGCGSLLRTAETKAAAITSVIKKARPYDIERRAALAQDKADQLPKKKQLDKAQRKTLKTLVSTAPRAARDLEPAMTQLGETDPSNKRAVKKALKDVALLAEASNAARTCARSLDTLSKAGVKAP